MNTNLVQISSCLVAEGPVEEGNGSMSWVQANGSVQVINCSRVKLQVVLQRTSAKMHVHMYNVHAQRIKLQKVATLYIVHAGTKTATADSCFSLIGPHQRSVALAQCSTRWASHLDKRPIGL